MRIQSQPVEGRRVDRFRPKFCPRSDCPDHRPTQRYRCTKAGTSPRKTGPRRRIQRYLCPTCGGTFSMRSFSCTYYLKRPELLLPVAALLVAGCAHRQIARSLGCAASTVTRLAARIGRHALLFQALALMHLDRLDEPVVFDHFETFVFSQEDRLAIASAVGQRSWFSYGTDGAPHRRGGRRSARKRALVRPLTPRQPDSVVACTRRVFKLLHALAGGPPEIVSDDHPAYRKAERLGPAVRRRIYPNPPRGPGCDRAAARERDREMFAVDLEHKIKRHTLAHQRRESIAFGRRANAVLEREFLFIVWRNFVKKVSERRSEAVTPAMRLGLIPRPLRWPEVFAERLFPGRVHLPEGWMKIYRRGWITPAVGRNLPHALVHAF